MVQSTHALAPGKTCFLPRRVLLAIARKIVREALRGHQVTQSRRVAITRLVGAQCYRARVSVASISEVSR
jgi:hypothetical protein